MKYLIIFIFFINSVIVNAAPKIKNIVIHKELKTYDNITFFDLNKKTIKLTDYRGKLVLLNFWATWCAPCKEEMPSLDTLKANPALDNIEIFPINMGKENLKKSKEFFKDLDIKNLNIYLDNVSTLAKDFNLRGLPTTILFNKNGDEFARIIGSIDFENKELIQWIKKYN
tara:strand:+ start:309 stop:818 length:510 start_codon:yes stop_codon:yes gene_type:complete